MLLCTVKQVFPLRTSTLKEKNIFMVVYIFILDLCWFVVYFVSKFCSLKPKWIVIWNVNIDYHVEVDFDFFLYNVCCSCRLKVVFRVCFEQNRSHFHRSFHWSQLHFGTCVFCIYFNFFALVFQICWCFHSLHLRRININNDFCFSIFI